jgi:hypothetical protein
MGMIIEKSRRKNVDNIERFLESTAKLIRYSDTLEMYHREMEV